MFRLFRLTTEVYESRKRGAKVESALAFGGLDRKEIQGLGFGKDGDNNAGPSFECSKTDGIQLSHVLVGLNTGTTRLGLSWKIKPFCIHSYLPFK